ncbi:MAG: nucleotidyltransferase domain-containing protein [Candidatus Hodarchaeota archaeon]
MFGKRRFSSERRTMEEKEIRHKLKLIVERYNLVAIYAFGSRAAEIAMLVKGKTVDARCAESDLDIGVQPARGVKLLAKDKVRLAIELEDLFRVQRIDLVVIPEAGPFLALDIILGELLYCKGLDEQAEHELYILRLAGDLAYYERHRRSQIL